MYIQPEPNNTIGAGAHYVCIFDNKREAQEHRKALTTEKRVGHLAGVHHRVTARKIKVEGAVVTVWVVTERRLQGAAADA